MYYFKNDAQFSLVPQIYYSKFHGGCDNKSSLEECEGFGRGRAVLIRVMAPSQRRKEILAQQNRMGLDFGATSKAARGN